MFGTACGSHNSLTSRAAWAHMTTHSTCSYDLNTSSVKNTNSPTQLSPQLVIPRISSHSPDLRPCPQLSWTPCCCIQQVTAGHKLSLTRSCSLLRSELLSRSRMKVVAAFKAATRTSPAWCCRVCLKTCRRAGVQWHCAHVHKAQGEGCAHTLQMQLSPTLLASRSISRPRLELERQLCKPAIAGGI